MLDWLATVALGPVLLLQGRQVRARATQLPEAPGPRRGLIGTGPRLRLLILGDSSAAGVGAPSQGEALSGRLVAALARRFGVQWELVARTGATTASTLRKIGARPVAEFDAVVIVLGVNDVTSGVGLEPWLEQQRELRRVLRDRFRARRLVVSGLPPMREFPALPQPLRWYLGRRTSRFSAALAADVALETDVRFLAMESVGEVDGMATDGFHPGPAIYQAWAAEVETLMA